MRSPKYGVLLCGIPPRCVIRLISCKADFYCELTLCFQEENSDYRFSIKSVRSDIKLDQDSRVERLVQNPEKDVEADQMDALEEYYRH